MRSNQRGSMLVFGAGILLFLSMFAFFAVDLGRIYITRNELQNVADSAALAGANCLTRQSNGASTYECTATISPTLNWARGQAKAQYQLGQNSAAGTAISTSDAGHVIEVGYFNLLTHAPSGGSYNTGFSPITVNDKPAVRVLVRKDTGVNDGPLALLSRVFGGLEAAPLQAEAVAVISNPNLVNPNNLVPQAINQCMLDQFWDTANNRPKIYTGTPPDPYGLSVIGQPWTVRIGSAYHYGTCDSGQWTTFDRDANSAAQVRDLVMNGNPNPLEIGDLTWIKPGTSTANYNDLINKYSPFPHDVNVLVIVDPANPTQPADLSHLPPNGRELEISAFAGFRITNIVGGSGKYIQGQFIPSNVVSGGGIGPGYGTYTPPRIAF